MTPMHAPRTLARATTPVFTLQLLHVATTMDSALTAMCAQPTLAWITFASTATFLDAVTLLQNVMIPTHARMTPV
jgi:hypothetical protein